MILHIIGTVTIIRLYSYYYCYYFDLHEDAIRRRAAPSLTLAAVRDATRELCYHILEHDIT